jgi:hypothetical protein
MKDCASDDYLIASYGKDGQRDAWQYNSANPEGGLYYDKSGIFDLVNYDGSFIRAPRANSGN